MSRMYAKLAKDYYAQYKGSKDVVDAFGTVVDIIVNKPDDFFVLMDSFLEYCDRDEKFMYYLAAGPIEDFLVYHGSQQWSEFKKYTKENKIFYKALQGVWKNNISLEVWNKLLRLRGAN